MGDQTDIRDRVDRLLTAAKTLSGESNFEPLNGDQRKQRWRKTCSVQGEVTPMDLEVQAYPEALNLKFRIVLIYQRAIWRLDFSNDGIHLNSTNRPVDLEPGPIVDVHYHCWSDNRRFATKTSLPSNLKNARKLPANVRAFDNAFRWFCGQTQITVPTAEIPMLPHRTALL